MSVLINFFSDKPLVFYFGMALLLLVGIQFFTALRRNRKTAKIHRVAGFMLVVTALIHAVLGFSLYL